MMYFAVITGLVFICFWIAQLLFVRFHLKWSDTIQDSGKEDEQTNVSVIHPVKDLDFEFEKNIESWLNQNYLAKVEHIFSFQEPDDPAISVVERIKKKYPDMDITIIVNPVIDGLTGKSSNMVHAL